MLSLAPTICRIMGISSNSISAKPELPLKYEGINGERICLITVDAMGISSLKRHSMRIPFLNDKSIGNIMRIRSEKPCSTAVNLTSMATGKDFSAHKILKKNQKITCSTFIDIMSRCGLSTAAVSYRESTLLSIIANTPARIISSEYPRDDETAYLTLKEIKNRAHNFIWVHFMDFDKVGHRCGPYSSDAAKAINNIDRLTNEIYRQCTDNGYTLIINADHGQHGTDGDLYGVHDGSSDEDLFTPFILPA